MTEFGWPDQSLRYVPALLFAYLIGSISGSLLLGKMWGVDIRKTGSGNAGATNALRTQGKIFALFTALIDLGKGALVVLLAPLFHLLPLPLLLTAVVGHCFPIYYNFRGGKGAGTGFGGFLVTLPTLAASAFAIWLTVLLIGGYVGPATFLATLGIVLLMILGIAPELDLASTLSAIAIALLIASLHIGNIQRWFAGTEYRFERARVFHRLWAKLRGT